MKEWHKSRTFSEAMGFAWNGIKTAYESEKNVRVQIFLLICALIAAILLRISLTQISILVLVSGSVLSLEMMNTALEKVEDLVWPEFRQAIKQSKDIAAGAVLIMSFAAAIIGALIFIPPFLKLLVY